MSNEVFEEIFARLEARIERLETNINLFTQTGNRMDLTIPAPEPEPEFVVVGNAEAARIDEAVRPEPEYEVEAEIDGKIVVIDDLEELVDTGTGADLAVPADIADEDALADETAVDDSEPPLSAA